MLTVTGIDLKAGSKQILSVSKFELGDKRITAVIGRNGSGKTSLLKSLALLNTAGFTSYELLGVRVNTAATRLAARQQMSLVFQTPRLLDGSALYNVALPLLLRGLSQQQAHFRALAWLDNLQARHLAQQHVDTLSGGEAARVSMARALVSTPRILFLDEPFSSLDVESRAYMVRNLSGWLGALNAQAILITHDYVEVIKLAGRLIVMDNGGFVSDGSPQQILSTPTSSYLRDFTEL